MNVIIVFAKLKRLDREAPSANPQPPTANQNDPCLARVRELTKGVSQ